MENEKWTGRKTFGERERTEWMEKDIKRVKDGEGELMNHSTVSYTNAYIL
jgi:hypothetical protein